MERGGRREGGGEGGAAKVEGMKVERRGEEEEGREKEEEGREKEEGGSKRERRVAEEKGEAAKWRDEEKEKKEKRNERETVKQTPKKNPEETKKRTISHVHDDLHVPSTADQQTMTIDQLNSAKRRKLLRAAAASDPTWVVSPSSVAVVLPTNTSPVAMAIAPTATPSPEPASNEECPTDSNLAESLLLETRASDQQTVADVDFVCLDRSIPMEEEEEEEEEEEKEEEEEGEGGGREEVRHLSEKNMGKEKKDKEEEGGGDGALIDVTKKMSVSEIKTQM